MISKGSWGKVHGQDLESQQVRIKVPRDLGSDHVSGEEVHGFHLNLEVLPLLLAVNYHPLALLIRSGSGM